MYLYVNIILEEGVKCLDIYICLCKIYLFNFISF